MYGYIPAYTQWKWFYSLGHKNFLIKSIKNIPFYYAAGIKSFSINISAGKGNYRWMLSRSTIALLSTGPTCEGQDTATPLNWSTNLGIWTHWLFIKGKFRYQYIGRRENLQIPESIRWKFLASLAPWMHPQIPTVITPRYFLHLQKWAYCVKNKHLEGKTWSRVVFYLS